MQLEKESDVEFEHIHVKTRNENEERGHGHERKLVLECDSASKEARVKCGDNYEIDHVQVRGNVSLKCKNKPYDKKTSEVIKKIDSENCTTECFKDKMVRNGI